MKQRWVRVIYVALALLLISAGVVSAQGVEHYQFPISGPIEGFYCGDTPYLTGTCHLAIDGESCDSAAVGRWSVRVHCQGEAVSSGTDARYRFTLSNLDKGMGECEPEQGVGHRVVTIHDNTRFISLGPQPNLLAKIRVHWTSNANGEWTAQFENVECKVVGRGE